MTPQELSEDYDWKEAFVYAGPGNVSRALGAECSDAGITTEDVSRILASSAGVNDGPDWLIVFETKDGRFAFLAAGCDFTGWDCQAGGCVVVSHALEHLLQFGLTDDARSRLGSELISALPPRKEGA